MKRCRCEACLEERSALYERVSKPRPYNHFSREPLSLSSGNCWKLFRIRYLGIPDAPFWSGSISILKNLYLLLQLFLSRGDLAEPYAQRLLLIVPIHQDACLTSA